MSSIHPARFRGMLLAVVGMAVVRAVPAAAVAPQVLEFDVFLDSKRIGTHRFEIQDRDGGLHVDTAAEFDVRVLGIRAYRYRHRDAEQWQAGCLRRIDADTDDNGKHIVVQGAAADATFTLQQPAQVLRSPCVVSYAYWDPARLLQRQELLNPQTGKLDAVRFEHLGEETIQVRGAPVRAVHHRLRSDKFTIDLWYSPGGEWLQLSSTTDSKRLLHYRLRSR